MPSNKDLIKDPNCTCGQNPRRQCPVHHQQKMMNEMGAKKAREHAERLKRAPK